MRNMIFSLSVSRARTALSHSGCFGERCLSHSRYQRIWLANISRPSQRYRAVALKPPFSTSRWSITILRTVPVGGAFRASPVQNSRFNSTHYWICNAVLFAHPHESDRVYVISDRFPPMRWGVDVTVALTVSIRRDWILTLKLLYRFRKRNKGAFGWCVNNEAIEHYFDVGLCC